MKNYLNLITLFLIPLISLNCNKTSDNSGVIKADLKSISGQADKVVIILEKNLIAGDSTQIKDTILLKNDSFQYNYTFKQPKRMLLKLLKNNVEVGIIVFKEKRLKNATLVANPLIGNENIRIKVEQKSSEHPQTFIAQIEGAIQNEMFRKTLTNEKITVKRLDENSSNFPMLWKLREFSQDYTSSELEILSSKFSEQVKQSPSFEILKRIISEKKNIEKFGYSKNFNWKDINGKSYNFEEARNGKKKVFIIFWASWCIPCRNEIPNLKEFYKKHNYEVSMVSLSIDEDYNRWHKAVQEEKMPWLNLSGLPDSKNAVMVNYDVHAVPTLTLLDEKGKVLERNSNDLNKIIDLVKK